ncbi:MAG: hypothetical protein SPL15_03725 [Lachnospiraceae bacterium]|nr:hypothetical protein [Lachnospiraceae bacterium]
MIQVEKQVFGKLNKCYSVAPLHYRGQDHLLVAAEKTDPCLLFTLDGCQVDQIWDGPGGTMSMVQVPGSDGVFLATQLFYSPNDSARAKIVIVTPGETGWSVRTLVELPFVHRFDIVESGGRHHLIACTLKSDHHEKDDWTHPGKVYAAILPEDLSPYNEEHQLPLRILKEGLYKNHGYYKIQAEGGYHCIVSTDNGIFRFVPPAAEQSDWSIECLLEEPASDAALVDLDDDGEDELAVISPFHGDEIKIYKNMDGRFRKVYEYEPKAPFSHSLYAGELCGRKRLVVGHRQGSRDLLVFTFDHQQRTYQVQKLDRDCGSANVFRFVKDKADYLLSTNRETDEIALYRLTEMTV